MARPIWTGSISFGLVNVPVKVYSAFRQQDLHFNQFDPMASQIISSLTTKWDPKRYHDTYRERVEDYLAKKAKGETVEVEPAPAEPSKVSDLMAALEDSLAAAKSKRRSPSPKRRAAPRKRTPTKRAATAQRSSRKPTAAGRRKSA